MAVGRHHVVLVRVVGPGGAGPALDTGGREPPGVSQLRAHRDSFLRCHCGSRIFVPSSATRSRHTASTGIPISTSPSRLPTTRRWGAPSRLTSTTVYGTDALRAACTE